MLRFLTGLALGLVLGLCLASIPAVSNRLAELGQVLSLSALATLL